MFRRRRAGEFYRFALAHCGRNVVIDSARSSLPRHLDRDNVTINRYSVIHHCDNRHYALVGEHVVLLSGSRQHDIDRDRHPMALQRGRKKRIALGRRLLDRAHAVVMEDVGCARSFAPAPSSTSRFQSS